jgi:hypothetical protein
MEDEMKRFPTTAVVFGVSFLAAWAIFQLYTISLPPSKNDQAPVKVQPAHSEAAVPVTGSESREIAPVFDDSGRVISDPSGTILNTRPSSDRKIAPVFDARGTLVSDPSGMIGSAGNSVAPGADVKVAPVYDASGRLISDPSGIIIASGNP